jgi:hypothetical protein
LDGNRVEEAEGVGIGEATVEERREKRRRGNCKGKSDLYNYYRVGNVKGREKKTRLKKLFPLR